MVKVFLGTTLLIDSRFVYQHDAATMMSFSLARPNRLLAVAISIGAGSPVSGGEFVGDAPKPLAGIAEGGCYIRPSAGDREPKINPVHYQVNGVRVISSSDEAVRDWRTATEQASPVDQRNLGFCYSIGAEDSDNLIELDWTANLPRLAAGQAQSSC